MRGEVSDILKYDDFPMPLRVQIVKIFEDAIGIGNTASENVYKYFHCILCREYGMFQLNNREYNSYFNKVFNSMALSMQVSDFWRANFIFAIRDFFCV